MSNFIRKSIALSDIKLFYELSEGCGIVRNGRVYYNVLHCTVHCTVSEGFKGECRRIYKTHRRKQNISMYGL